MAKITMTATSEAKAENYSKDQETIAWNGIYWTQTGDLIDLKAGTQCKKGPMIERGPGLIISSLIVDEGVYVDLVIDPKAYKVTHH